MVCALSSGPGPETGAAIQLRMRYPLLEVHSRNKEWPIVRRVIVLCAVLLMSVGSGGAVAQELGVGDPAPPFELPGSDGRTHSLAEYAGKTVVLAWFPKAFTGG